MKNKSFELRVLNSPLLSFESLGSSFKLLSLFAVLRGDQNARLRLGQLSLHPARPALFHIRTLLGSSPGTRDPAPWLGGWLCVGKRFKHSMELLLPQEGDAAHTNEFLAKCALTPSSCQKNMAA